MSKNTLMDDKQPVVLENKRFDSQGESQISAFLAFFGPKGFQIKKRFFKHWMML